MWSCGSVLEGRKDGSGLMFNRDRVLRWDDWCRRLTSASRLLQLWLCGQMTERTKQGAEKVFIPGYHCWSSTTERTQLILW